MGNEQKIKHLLNIKTSFETIFGEWLLANDINDSGFDMFSAYIEESDSDTESKENKSPVVISIFRYIDCAYPILAYDDNDQAIDNRWQSCINAVNSFANKRLTSLSAQHKLIHEVTAIISCLNSSINVLQKLKRSNSDEAEALELMSNTATAFAQQAFASIEAVKEELFAKVQDSTKLTSFNMLLDYDEYDFAEISEDEAKSELDEEDELVTADDLNGYKEPDSSDKRRLSPTSVNLACSNIFGGELQQHTKADFKINYREFVDNDESTLLFDCVSVDASSAMQQALETVLVFGKEQADSYQNIKLCIVPIAGTDAAQHFITLAIEYNRNGYKAYLIDSKNGMFGNIFNSPVAAVIEQVLKNIYSQDMAFEKLFLGHQAILDNTSCGYFTIKIVEALIKNKAVSAEIFPAANTYFGSANNLLKPKDIFDINMAIASGGSLTKPSEVVSETEEEETEVPQQEEEELPIPTVLVSKVEVIVDETVAETEEDEIEVPQQEEEEPPIPTVLVPEVEVIADETVAETEEEEIEVPQQEEEELPIPIVLVSEVEVIVDETVSETEEEEIEVPQQEEEELPIPTVLVSEVEVIVDETVSETEEEETEVPQQEEEELLVEPELLANKRRKLVLDDTRETVQVENIDTNRASRSSFLGKILYPFTLIMNVAMIILNGIKRAISCLCCIQNNDIELTQAENIRTSEDISDSVPILQQSAARGMLSALSNHHNQNGHLKLNQLIPAVHFEQLAIPRNHKKRVLRFD